MDDLITRVYSGQVGGALPFFQGSQSQWGGGLLQTIGRFAFPILKRILGVATNTAEDVIEGRKSFKDSLVDNALEEVKNVVMPTATAATSINRKRPQTQKSKHRKKLRQATTTSDTLS
jgi:hypothetical protein